jgi:hypothetical protein
VFSGFTFSDTIFIAFTLKQEDEKLPKPKYTDRAYEHLKEAWDIQLQGTPSVLMDVDVDKNCLEILEEEMFENSARAGIAGHFQWGLGDHQAYPYENIREIWNPGDRAGDDGELEVSLRDLLLDL